MTGGLLAAASQVSRRLLFMPCWSGVSMAVAGQQQRTTMQPCCLDYLVLRQVNELLLIWAHCSKQQARTCPAACSDCSQHSLGRNGAPVPSFS